MNRYGVINKILENGYFKVKLYGDELISNIRYIGSATYIKNNPTIGDTVLVDLDNKFIFDKVGD